MTGGPRHLARTVFVAFLFTFLAARVLVFLIMTRRIPDLYLNLSGTHVHHLNYGIFLLSVDGAWLLFRRPSGRALTAAALLYGIGLALTFDEFGMWLHLGGPYWQRASFDAITVIAGLLALAAFAPRPSELRARYGLYRVRVGIVAVLLAVGIAVFGTLLWETTRRFGHTLAPSFEEIERNAPR